MLRYTRKSRSARRCHGHEAVPASLCQISARIIIKNGRDDKKSLESCVQSPGMTTQASGLLLKRPRCGNARMHERRRNYALCRNESSQRNEAGGLFRRPAKASDQASKRPKAVQPTGRRRIGSRKAPPPPGVGISRGATRRANLLHIRASLRHKATRRVPDTRRSRKRASSASNGLSVYESLRNPRDIEKIPL